MNIKCHIINQKVFCLVIYLVDLFKKRDLFEKRDIQTEVPIHKKLLKINIFMNFKATKVYLH